MKATSALSSFSRRSSTARDHRSRYGAGAGEGEAENKGEESGEAHSKMANLVPAAILVKVIANKISGEYVNLEREDKVVLVC
ncbi:hypothetical protein BgiBS90_012062 [Biomphalaria glabrata]|nr:hypothetical protein BgiBS90_012062 [Biomphalaria glabrata]